MAALADYVDRLVMVRLDDMLPLPRNTPLRDTFAMVAERAAKTARIAAGGAVEGSYAHLSLHTTIPQWPDG
jgi:hypothetical protein